MGKRVLVEGLIFYIHVTIRPLMQLVKLGGSVITVKSRYRYFLQQTTRKIVHELKKIDDEIILVHGGGSFGHIKASEYQLSGSPASSSRSGISIVHRDMMELDQRIIGVMLSESMPGIGMAPSSFPDPFIPPFDLIESYMKAGLFPVTFGDVYIRNGNSGIVSGDDLMLALAIHFKPTRVMFLSDVDGIFDRNPKTHPDAELRKEVKGNEAFELNREDVTGGMGKKLGIMKKIAETGTTVYLLNGRHPERIWNMGTRDFIGTVIR